MKDSLFVVVEKDILYLMDFWYDIDFIVAPASVLNRISEKCFCLLSAGLTETYDEYH